jgi:hypothetical protein
LASEIGISAKFEYWSFGTAKVYVGNIFYSTACEFGFLNVYRVEGFSIRANSAKVDALRKHGLTIDNRCCFRAAFSFISYAKYRRSIKRNVSFEGNVFRKGDAASSVSFDSYIIGGED